jgi:peroxiredoxin
LAAFSKAYARLQEEGIGVVAASTDPLGKARATAEEQSLTFPVGHGLPLRETASRVGAFYDPKRGVLHATGFVIRPDRTIAVAQYSSGPIGRLVWQDVLGLVQFYKRQAR